MPRMSAEPTKPLVVVRTLVYNHAPFLRDCLNGIVMQETTFPFVAVVHDDASTDGSADIIREYAEKYPDIIKPIYEKENQYSKRDGSLSRVMNTACELYGAKYRALCEGDDYWTSPHKLQMQVDWLEQHPEYSMVCCNGVIQTPDETLSTAEEYQKLNWPYKQETGDCTLEELVKLGGRYILTAGLVYRRGIRDLYPPECRNLPCGDYVLKLFAALTGKIYYFADRMVVYRFQSLPTAWSVKQLTKKVNHLKDIAWKHDVHLLAAADRYSEFKYMALFRAKAFAYAKGFLEMYPHIRKEIMQEMGYVLEYRYHQPYIRQGRLRWYLSHSVLWPEWLRFFCVSRAQQFSLGLGRLHFLAIYRKEQETLVNICGKTILRLKRS